MLLDTWVLWPLRREGAGSPAAWVPHCSCPGSAPAQGPRVNKKHLESLVIQHSLILIEAHLEVPSPTLWNGHQQWAVVLAQC